MISSSSNHAVRSVRKKRSGPNGESSDIRQSGATLNFQVQEHPDMSVQMRTLAGHLQTVREEERMRIAREIHDELGQVLTALKMDLSWIRNQLPAERRDLIEKTQSDLELIGTAVQSVNRICTDLRPDILDTLGLGAAIEWKANDFERRTGIRCGALIVPEDMTLDKERTTTLFRIFQEALTNIVKHAHATEVQVSLLMDHAHVALEVSDNGVGIQQAHLNKANSFGLLGMRERVIPWKGEVTVGNGGSRGTLIRVVLSLSGVTHSSPNGRGPHMNVNWRQLENLLCSLMS